MSRRLETHDGKMSWGFAYRARNIPETTRRRDDPRRVSTTNIIRIATVPRSSTAAVYLALTDRTAERGSVPRARKETPARYKITSMNTLR